ncbi:class I adenylate-forming enzyme family protein [Plantactinospora sp. GCM10030261]|uniref:class I adenylate-forming enzyme family protein n=1 Tax=Plantactinospora sp. GCM10030261 TaxID=3273420 RepID=UPI00360C497B
MSVLCQALREIAADRPDQVAVVDVDDTPIRYGELVALVERLAAGLYARGVREGDTVAFALPNSARYVALILAVARIGARYVPLMANFGPEDTRRAIEQSTPVLLVADREHHVPPATVPVVAPQTLAADAPEPPAKAYTGLFRQLWTSGSTGFPKMMVWRQDKFLTERRRWLADVGIRPDDVFYCRHPLDVAHATDLHMFAALLSGARLVLADPADPPAAYLARLRRSRATVMSALPAHYEMLVRAAEQTGGPVDLPAMRLPMCGGAYLSPAVVRATAERLGVHIRQIYGSTEFGIAAGNMADELQTAGTVTAVQGVGMRIAPLVDGHGDIGELVLRSPCTSEGYLFADEANRRTFREGEFWTGDVAQRTTAGAIRVIGRVSEVLTAADGPLPAPLLDAECVAACPESEVVCLLAEPGTLSDRVIVVIDPGTTPAADVTATVRDILDRHRLRADLHLVEGIPHTPVGKVDKPALRRQFVLASR